MLHFLFQFPNSIQKYMLLLQNKHPTKSLRRNHLFVYFSFFLGILFCAWKHFYCCRLTMTSCEIRSIRITPDIQTKRISSNKISTHISCTMYVPYHKHKFKIYWLLNRTGETNEIWSEHTVVLTSFFDSWQQFSHLLWFKTYNLQIRFHHLSAKFRRTFG